MSGVVLSSAVRQNLLALQNTAAQLATTQNDLSTGKKVNSALDNPTNFFTASGLDNRASDISNLLDGISNGVQVLQAANTGLTSLQTLVSSAKSIANQALQTSIGYSTKSSITSSAITGATASNLLGTPANGTLVATTGAANKTAGDNSGFIQGSSALNGTGDSVATTLTTSDSLVVDGKTINFASTGTNSFSASGATINFATGTVNDILTAINTIAPGTATIDGTTGKITLNTGTSTTGLTISGTANVVSDLGLGTVTATGVTGTFAGVTASTQSAVGLTPLNSSQTLSIAANADGSIPATTITFGTNTAAGQVSTLDQLNTKLAASNLQATISSAGVLTISTTNDSASETIGAVTAGGTGNPFTSGTPSAPVADPTSQATRAGLVNQYNALLTQIDNTASDSSYNGVNLLNGDQLQLTFDETGKSKLSITGVNDSAAGLGLSALSTTAFKDNTSTNAVIANLTAASTTLRSQASSFGSNLSVVQTRQDFNTNLINVLQTGSANLTQADINLEAANSQALNTRQSLSVSALSLANQSQQSVLQLLR